LIAAPLPDTKMPRRVVSELSIITESLKSVSPLGNDADQLLEAVAMTIDDLDVGNIENLKTLITHNHENFSKVEAASIQKFALIKSEPSDQARTQGLSTRGFVPDIKMAVSTLAKSRLKRNVSKIKQYVGKNLGGVKTSILPQKFDTVFKAMNIFSALRTLGVKFDNPDNVLHMYGIAYDHFSTATDVLEIMDTIEKLDAFRAKRSVAVFQTADVFDASGKRIIDDTLVRTIPDRLIKFKTQYKTPDHLKLQQLLTNNPGFEFVVSKIDLNNFAEPGQQIELMNILYGVNKNDPAADYIKIVKFGKLHNSEAFLIAVNGVATKRKRYGGVMADLNDISQIMLAANDVIDYALLLSIRPKKSKIMVEIAGACASRWPWYMSEWPKSKPFEGGRHANVINVDLEAVRDDDGVFDVGYTHIGGGGLVDDDPVYVSNGKGAIGKEIKLSKKLLSSSFVKKE